jgi:4-amino-4-deoxy-L-arabinose transferase-like glycosyltransferase
LKQIDKDTIRALLISLLVAACYMFIASRSTLWDRDEPRFSRAAVEMVESGNYLYPTFNGELRPDKPVLIYWLMSLPIRLFGATAFACRFWGAIGTALTAFLTYRTGRLLYDSRTGMLAMGIVSSTLLVFMLGTFATADSVLLPCMLAVLYLFFRALKAGRLSFSTTMLMGGAFGLALLAKGPVGLLPLAVILVTSLIRRHEVSVGKILPRAFGAAIIGAGLFLIWAIPANNATAGEFFRLGIGKHVIERSTSAMESHGGNFILFLPYYIFAVIFGFYPWSLHIGAAVTTAFGGRLGANGRTILLGWALPVIAILTCVATKLPHYIILTWPAFAILTAAFLTGKASELSNLDRHLLRGGIWFYGIINTAAALGCLAMVYYFRKADFNSVWPIVCGVVLLVTGSLANKLQLKEKPLESTRVLVRGLAVFMFFFAIFLLPDIERVKITPRLTDAILPELRAETRICSQGYSEPSVNFYLGRPIESLDAADMQSWFAGVDDGVFIVDQKYLPEQLPDGVRELCNVYGFNYTKGKYQMVYALEKRKAYAQDN